MTIDRSFAPADRDPAPAFPLWPFAMTAYVHQCSRDYAGYLGRLATAHGALDVIAAEEALGLDLLTDAGQAWREMFWSPIGAAMAAVDAAASPPDA